MASPSTTRDYRNAVADLPDAFLKCRDLGHDWKMYHHRKNGRGWERKFFCPSCKTNRHCKYNRYGEVTSNRYQYDRNYMLKQLGGQMAGSKAVIRLEALSRTAEFDVDPLELFAS